MCLLYQNKDALYIPSHGTNPNKRTGKTLRILTFLIFLMYDTNVLKHTFTKSRSHA